MRRSMMCVLACILCSCQGVQKTPVACDDIIDPPLKSVPFASLTTQDAGDWIRTNYPSGTLLQVDRGPSYYWQYRGRDYGAHFAGNNQSVSYQLKPAPTISDVIICYGKPDLYRITSVQEEVPGIELALWYIDLGYEFSSVRWGSTASNRFDGASQMTDVTIVRPGILEDMVRNLYSEQYVTKVLSELQPWPSVFSFIQPDSQ